jgi:hypothetical protein
MLQNPLRSLLPLIRVAAASIVGPFGFVVAPALAAVTIRMGETLSHDQLGMGPAVFEVLNHILGHLSGDATKEFFDSLGELSNHDLKRATVAALREALSYAHDSIAQPDRILVDRFDSWFELWDRRLERGLKSVDEMATLFYSETEVDPIMMANLDESDLWPVCQPLLLRWAADQQIFIQSHQLDTSSLPGELEEYLANQFAAFARHGMNMVLREKSHRRGWIAWQQRFMEAVAHQARASNLKVAERLEFLAKNGILMNSWLVDQLSRVNNRLDAIYELLQDDVVRQRGAEVTVVLSPGTRLRAVQRQVKARLNRSARAASTILIAGMPRPVPSNDVYRVLHVGRSEFDVHSSMTVDDIITGVATSAVLLAPPGRGKTSTLQHAYNLLARNTYVLPLLYFLKESKSLSEVHEVISALKENGVDLLTSSSIVLLLDGYDEIDYENRKNLSVALSDLASVARVRFLLTCRTYYEIVDLPVDRYYLLPFTEADACAFLSCFLRTDRDGNVVPNADAKAHELLQLMKRRGFDDFLGTPLFLALTAILQTGEKPKVPRNAIRLLESVIYYLTSQWDRERGVNREGLSVDRGVRRQNLINIEGEDLLTCMKRIAAAFDNMEGSTIVAEREVREHLAAMQVEKVEPQTFLREIARWFGLFVPSLSGEWSFVHRAVHEYLAAKLMVETGQFNADKARRNWRRAHFAACMLPDAADYICRALRSGDELEMFVECCSNDANFTPMNVAHALIEFYDTPKESCPFIYDEMARSVVVTLNQDYLDVVKTPFLRRWVDLATRRGGFRRGALISLALALSELRDRREPVDEATEFYKFAGIRWHVTRVGLGGATQFTTEEIRSWTRGGSDTSSTSA